MKLPLALRFAHLLGMAKGERPRPRRHQKNKTPPHFLDMPKGGPAPEPKDEEQASVAERRAYHTAARAERARWAAVIGDPAQQGALLPAAVALLSTGMAADAVNRTLAGMCLPAPRAERSALLERMARRPPLNVGMDAPGHEPTINTDVAFARRVEAAVAKARPPLPPVGHAPTPLQIEHLRAATALPHDRRPA